MKIKFINMLAPGFCGHEYQPLTGHNECENVSRKPVRSTVTRRSAIASSWQVHGLVLLVSLTLLAHCVTSSRTPDGDWEDDDTIVIQADNTVHSENQGHVRVKRQGTYVLPQVLQEQASEVNEGDPCISPKGESGTCVPLKMCYAYMYQFDLADDGMYTGNMELANSLRETVGSCVTQTETAVPYGSHYFFAIRTKQPDLICCTGNYTKIAIPAVAIPFIHGGQRAQSGQFPMMAAIMNNGRLLCGGSIIDSTHVLTAAHCVSHMGGSQLSRLTLQIGDHSLYSTADGPHQTKKVQRLSKHKQFSQSILHNDIAILTMSSPVTFNGKVRQIGLSSGAGSAATVAGWGRQYDGGPFPSELYYANVQVVPNPSCKQKYSGIRGHGGIINSMLCAGSRSNDACSGDSGGPLMSGGSQIGIVSWGIGCGNYPGVYTRVSSFSSWIQKNLRH